MGGRSPYRRRPRHHMRPSNCPLNKRLHAVGNSLRPNRARPSSVISQTPRGESFFMAFSAMSFDRTNCVRFFQRMAPVVIFSLSIGWSFPSRICSIRSTTARAAAVPPRSLRAVSIGSSYSKLGRVAPLGARVPLFLRRPRFPLDRGSFSARAADARRPALPPRVEPLLSDIPSKRLRTALMSSISGSAFACSASKISSSIGGSVRTI